MSNSNYSTSSTRTPSPIHQEPVLNKLKKSLTILNDAVAEIEDYLDEVVEGMKSLRSDVEDCQQAITTIMERLDALDDKQRENMCVHEQKNYTIRHLTHKVNHLYVMLNLKTI